MKAASNRDFAALVESVRQDVHFEPLIVPEPVSAFQAFSIKPESQVVSPETSQDTYQRTTPTLAEHPSGLKSLLAAKDHEIEQLKLLISTQVAALAELESRMESDKARLQKLNDDVLSSQINDALSGIEVRIAAELAQDLAAAIHPFVSAQICQRVLDEFNTAFGKCLTGNELTKIKISGPADLIAGFRQAFDGRLTTCELTEAETIEISAEVNNKLISTRLAFWSTLLTGQ